MEDLVTRSWPTETQLFYHSIIHYVVLFLSISTTSLATIAVFKASPNNMGTHKYLLLHQIATNFLINLFSCLWAPIIVVPAACLFSSSFIFRSLSWKYTRWLLIIEGAFAIQKTLALTIALVHRISVSLSETNWFHKIYFLLWPWLQIGSSCLVQLLTIVFGYIKDDRYDGARVHLETKSPSTKSLFQTEPSLLCMLFDESGYLKLHFLASIGVLFLCALFSTLAYSAYLIHKQQTSFHPKTLTLLRMLLRVCFIETIAFVIFIVLPSIFIYIDLLYSVPITSNHVIFVFFLLASHSIVDTLIIILLIRNYRHYVFELLTCSKTRASNVRLIIASNQ